MAAEQIGERRAGALVRDVREIDLRRRHEERAGEVRRVAHAGRAEIELAGLRARERHELLRRLHRQRRVHDHDLAVRQRDLRDRREILVRVVRELAVHQRVRVVRTGGVEQRVAVARALRDHLGADHAGRAGPVVERRSAGRGTSESFCTIGRPMTSGGPPGANGTIIRMGFDGIVVGALRLRTGRTELQCRRNDDRGLVIGVHERSSSWHALAGAPEHNTRVRMNLQPHRAAESRAR